MFSNNNNNNQNNCEFFAQGKKRKASAMSEAVDVWESDDFSAVESLLYCTSKCRCNIPGFCSCVASDSFMTDFYSGILNYTDAMNAFNRMILTIEELQNSFNTLRMFCDADPNSIGLKRHTDTFKEDVKKNLMYKFFLSMTPTDIKDICSRNNIGKFLAYKLRSRLATLRYCIDHEMSGSEQTMYSQGTAISKIVNYFVPRLEEEEITVGSYVAQILSDMWESIVGIGLYFSSEISKTIGRVKQSFINFLKYNVFGEFFMTVIGKIDDTTRVIVNAVCLFCIYVVLRITKLVGPPIYNAIKNKLVTDSSECMVAQSGESTKSLVTLLCKSVFILDDKKVKLVWEAYDEIQKSLEGGSILDCPYKSFLVGMPTIIKYALVLMLGDKEEQLKYEIDMWRNQALALCALGKTTTVVASPLYEEKVTICMKKGSEIMRKMPSTFKSSMRGQCTLAYGKLLSIHTNLLARKENKRDRIVPFAFHMSGKSGIGKTSSLKEMAFRGFNMSKEDIFWKSIDDSFFSGVADEPMIVMDEFLVDSKEAQMETIKTYLTMVSSAQFRPPLASVDDPNVGIKGTCLRPSVVVTMNNHNYTNVDHMVNTAYQRRRKFVIHVKPSKYFIPEETNKDSVDLSQYSREDLMSRKWASYDIYPPVGVPGAQPYIKDMTFDEMCEFVTCEYKAHMEKSRVYNSAMNTVVSDEREPSDVINEVLRDSFDIPAKPLSLTDTVVNFGILACQGPKGKKAKICDPETDLDKAIAEQIELEYATQGEVYTDLETSENRRERSVLNSLRTGLCNNKSAIAMGSLVSILSGVAYYFSSKEAPEEPVTYCAQSDKSSKTSGSNGKRNKFIRADTLKSQGMTIPMIEIMLPTRTIKAIAVGGDWFLTYAHGLSAENTDNGTPVMLHYEGESFPSNVQYSTMFSCDEDDVTLIQFDCKRLRRFKNITKNFISGDEVNKIANAQVMMNSGLQTFYSRANLVKNLRYINENTKKSLTLSEAIKYQAPTDVGDCGSPVICMSGVLSNKIIGMHVCGSGQSNFAPTGAATIVTRESLNEAMASLEMSAQGFVDDEMPNYRWSRKIRSNERVNLPTKSKLQPSEISEHLKFKRVKQPAILHSSDPRSNGKCPIQESLLRLYKTETPTMDTKFVKRIEDELFCELDGHLDFHGYKRKLTFEEACKGIPKYLNSISTKTSPGYPLCNISKKKGKTDFVWFDEKGELDYAQSFKRLVLERVKVMDEYQKGSPIDHRFLGFLKDELVKQKKIDTVNTRMIFANDMISLVAFRMQFGAMLMALMTNFEKTGFAIGLNQYSHDMERIYQYLIQASEDMVAGDFSEFDKRFIKQIEEACYRIFTRLAQQAYGVSENACNYLVEHETNSPFQIGEELVSVHCSNKSGNFLTTCINSLTDNFYIRYCFYRKYPAKQFSNECKVVVLGDDHVLAMKENSKINPVEICELMKEIGQKYTSAFKDRELVETFDKFEDVTFLGAIPRISEDGQFTGALRKDTLFETPQWTRDCNASLDSTVQQMLDCASQWDKDFFDDYARQIKQSYADSDRDWTLNDNYYSLHHAVSRRTASSGEDFSVFFAQGSRETGLTSLMTSEMTEGEYDHAPSMSTGLASLSLNERELDINYGLESFVKRQSFDWPSTAAVGTTLSSARNPFELLSLGNQNNIQNMPFENYIYFVADTDVAIQVNGTPTQQGLLVAYYTPLNSTKVQYDNVASFPHVFLTPNDSSTKILTLPYTFFRSAMNTYAGALGTEYTGKIYIDVYSPLSTGSLPTSCTVTLYTRFRGKFTIPRPVPAESGAEELVFGRGERRNYATLKREPELSDASDPILKAQGATYSTSSVKNNYTISDVAGNIPIENRVGVSTEQSAKGELSMALPMDNPPLASGSIPVYNQYSGMSTTCGVEPTVEMSMHPCMLHREADANRDVMETNIEKILNHRNYLQTFTFSTSDVEGDVLMNIPLNSNLATRSSDTTSYVINPAIFVLNQFLFWRADVELEFCFVKTMFHSGRLLATTAYGAPGIVAGEENIFINQVMEVQNENSWTSIKIPYNAATEYLRTYEGKSAWDAVQDYSMGTFQISVANILRSSSSVVDTSIKVLVFCKFSNVQVYGVRPQPNVVVQGGELFKLKTQGPVDGIVEVEEKTGDDSNPISNVITAEETGGQEQKPCTLTIGRKFEYNVKDIHELTRRHTRIKPRGYRTASVSYTSGGGISTGSEHKWPVRPKTVFDELYMTWSGHIKYRIFVNYENTTGQRTPVVNFITCPKGTSSDAVNYTFGHISANSTGGSQESSWNAATDAVREDDAVWPGAEERMYMIGTNSFMIDISIPFNTHYNKLPVTQEEWVDGNFMNGFISLIVPLDVTGSSINHDVAIYQATGDDFRFSDWCPIKQLRSIQCNNVSGTMPPTKKVVGSSILLV